MPTCANRQSTTRLPEDEAPTGLKRQYDGTRQELATLQASVRWMTESPQWTPELESHLEALQAPFHAKAFDLCVTAGACTARTLDDLHLKASMLMELCDPCSDDLRELLMVSLCRDVFLLERCSFKEGNSLA